jgi:hypothetical protein
VFLFILPLDTCGAASVDFPIDIVPGILVYPKAVASFACEATLISLEELSEKGLPM